VTQQLADRSPPGSDLPCLRTRTGDLLAVPAHRWLEPVTPTDRRLLRQVHGPVIDIGCGPGRHVLELAQAGVVSLGIDISPPAVARARRDGAPVLHRSVFDHVPGSGRWRTALLLDGNLGIGGAPDVLLRRVAELLRHDGRVLVELDPPGATQPAQTVRFELDGQAGPWFQWSSTRPEDLAAVTSAAGFRIRRLWHDSTRYFAQLVRSRSEPLRSPGLKVALQRSQPASRPRLEA